MHTPLDGVIPPSYSPALRQASRTFHYHSWDLESEEAGSVCAGDRSSLQAFEKRHLGEKLTVFG